MDDKRYFQKTAALGPMRLASIINRLINLLEQFITFALLAIAIRKYILQFNNRKQEAINFSALHKARISVYLTNFIHFAFNLSRILF